MDFNEIDQEIEKLEGSKEVKHAILKLIKIKTDSDMDKVVNAISILKSETNAAIGSLNTKLESSIGSLNTKIDASNSKIDNIKWFIVSVGAILFGLAKIFKLF